MRMTLETDRPKRDSDEIRILDHHGCLTPEALCFVAELSPDQRAAVERHARSCTICAQQQTSLARTTERFRRARPRVPLPTEVKVLARQAALRSLAVAHRRPPRSNTARLRVHGHEPWHRSRAFWIAVIAAIGTTIVLVGLALIFLR